MRMTFMLQLQNKKTAKYFVNCIKYNVILGAYDEVLKFFWSIKEHLYVCMELLHAQVYPAMFKCCGYGNRKGHFSLHSWTKHAM